MAMALCNLEKDARLFLTVSRAACAFVRHDSLLLPVVERRDLLAPAVACRSGTAGLQDRCDFRCGFGIRTSSRFRAVPFEVQRLNRPIPVVGSHTRSLFGLSFVLLLRELLLFRRYELARILSM